MGLGDKMGVVVTKANGCRLPTCRVEGQTTRCAMKIPRTRATVATTLLASAVILGGLAAGGNLSDDSSTLAKSTPTQTYGSALGVMNDADLPDMISAYATNGRIGYIKKEDSIPPEQTRDDVLGQQLPETRIVPVYDYDGTTVIGEFEYAP